MKNLPQRPKATTLRGLRHGDQRVPRAARFGSIEWSGVVLGVFGYPPEDFAEDLPFGGIADVEGKVLGICGDEKVGAY